MVLLKLALIALTLSVVAEEVRSTGVTQWAEEPAFIPPPHMRSHFRENGNLNPLSENELETLLFLLEKVRPDGGEQRGSGHNNERRSKRVGHAQLHKKAVDWSNYWGIDKRSAPALPVPMALHSSQGQPQGQAELHQHGQSENGKKPPNLHQLMTPAAAAPAKTPATDKKKESALKAFYKSMALATNMKRKRSVIEVNDLEERMKDAGDDLIWDALKLTGSQKDRVLSKEDLGKLKARLIKEIGAAYSLEKLRHILGSRIGQ